MSLLVSALTRFASCVILFAIILYAPALVHAFVLPKWVWYARSVSGVARRQPTNVACPRRLAEAKAEVIAVRYDGPRRTPNRLEKAACRLAADWRA
jgi:hypothetical protein